MVIAVFIEKARSKEIEVILLNFESSGLFEDMIERMSIAIVIWQPQ